MTRDDPAAAETVTKDFTFGSVTFAPTPPGIPLTVDTSWRGSPDAPSPHDTALPKTFTLPSGLVVTDEMIRAAAEAIVPKGAGATVQPAEAQPMASGATLLDHFAGLAMQVELSAAQQGEEWGAMAQRSYRMADAMLAERARRSAR